MIDVEHWAEIRRMHFVDGVSIREIRRRTGLHRETIRRALAAKRPPAYHRAKAPSKLDPFKREIERLLRSDHRMPGTRIRELLAELGNEGGKTILDDHLREVRPRFAPRRTYQRTVYRPGEICQFDLWEPRGEIPVGHGQTRRGWVVTSALGYSRAGAGALIFSKQAPDILWGMGRCLAKLGALPETVVWDREGAIAPKGKPTEAFAAFCGSLPVGWSICEAEDPESKGVLERSHRFLRSNFEPGRSFASPEHFQACLDEWFENRANTRLHRGIRAVPAERLAEEVQRMRALPECTPDTDRRFVMRVPQQPYLRFDTNDYSLDPRAAGLRVEVCVTQRKLTAVELGTGAMVASHRRSFAKGPHLHRFHPPAAARPAARQSPAGARRRGRAALPATLRRADPGMTKTAELNHLFRALKAPAAARAVPKLAERAREEEWSHERFLEAVLSTEVSSRESHG